jgi:DhnA family fructose-bisphosphate aldolase class Ia
MDSRTGKKIRMGRLFNQRSGRSLIVAYSHGILMGPRPGIKTLEEMRRVTQSVVRADGLMVAPGMLSRLEDAFVGRDHPSLVIHLDFQSFSRDILPYREGATVELAQVEDVLVAGADAVMTYLYVGYEDPEREKMEIDRNARLARACEKWGLALMIEPRSARERTIAEDKTNPKLLAMYCRISAEIGADVVKCIYPGNVEALRTVVQGCPAPLLVAGGAKADNPEDAYRQAQSAMEAGAAGLVFGRNIYESNEPAAELARYHGIVHGE